MSFQRKRLREARGKIVTVERGGKQVLSSVARGDEGNGKRERGNWSVRLVVAVFPTPPSPPSVRARGETLYNWKASLKWKRFSLFMAGVIVEEQEADDDDDHPCPPNEWNPAARRINEFIKGTSRFCWERRGYFISSGPENTPPLHETSAVFPTRNSLFAVTRSLVPAAWYISASQIWNNIVACNMVASLAVGGGGIFLLMHAVSRSLEKLGSLAWCFTFPEDVQHEMSSWC